MPVAPRQPVEPFVEIAAFAHRPTGGEVESRCGAADARPVTAPLDEVQRHRRVVVDDGLPRREHECELSSAEIDTLGKRDGSVAGGSRTGVTGERQREGLHRQDQRSEVGSKLSDQRKRLALLKKLGGLIEEFDGGRDLAAVERDESEQAPSVAHRDGVAGRCRDRLDLLRDRRCGAPVPTLYRLH